MSDPMTDTYTLEELREVLRQDNRQAFNAVVDLQNELDRVRAQLAAAEQAIAELVAGLKPFGEWASRAAFSCPRPLVQAFEAAAAIHAKYGAPQ